MMRFKHYNIHLNGRDYILKHNLKNVMETPKLEKLVIDTTTSDAIQDMKNLIPGFTALEAISCQKPNLTYSKKAIANFKLRKNQLVGCFVTLRQKRLFGFLEKFIYILICQNPDFRGLKHQLNNTALYLQNDLQDQFILPEEKQYRESVASEQSSGTGTLSSKTLNDLRFFDHLKKTQFSGAPLFKKLLRCANFRFASLPYRLRLAARQSQKKKTSMIFEDQQSSVHKILFRKHTISLGFSNILVFPELETHYESFHSISGINIHVTAKNILPFQLATNLRWSKKS